MPSPGCASRLRRPTSCGSICCYNTPMRDALVRRVLIITAWKNPGLETCFPGFDREERRQRDACASLGGGAARLRACAGHGVSAELTVTGRAGSRYRLLFVVRQAHFRLHPSGWPAVRAALRPVRTCAAAIATALRRWRRARHREPHAGQRAAEVRDKGGTRSPHDGQNSGLHDWLRRCACCPIGSVTASARTAARGFASGRMDGNRFRQVQ